MTRYRLSHGAAPVPTGSAALTPPVNSDWTNVLDWRSMAPEENPDLSRAAASESITHSRPDRAARAARPTAGSTDEPKHAHRNSGRLQFQRRRFIAWMRNAGCSRRVLRQRGSNKKNFGVP